jgi:dihydropteroate synthase
MSGHHAVYINDLQEARYYLNQIGVADEGYAFMAPKAVYRCILLKDIPCRWANIIKQEMLSRGEKQQFAAIPFMLRAKRMFY